MNLQVIYNKKILYNISYKKNILYKTYITPILDFKVSNINHIILHILSI